MKNDHDAGGEDRSVELIGLGIVLVLSLLLRIRHLDALLPWFVYFDEVRNSTVCLRLIQLKTLDPDFFLYPTLGFYIHTFFYLVWAAPGQLGAMLRSGPGSLFDFFSSMGPWDHVLIMVSRWVSVVFGVGSVFMTWLIGRLYLTWRWALFAALLMALNPIHISISAIAKVDSINCFFLLAGFYLISLYIRRGGLPYLIAAAVLAGMSFMVKYYPVVCIWLTTVVFFKATGKGKGIKGLLFDRDLVLALLVIWAATFACSPYLFIGVLKVLQNIGSVYYQSTVSSVFHTDPHSWWLDRHYYIHSVILPTSYGLALYLAVFIGSFHHIRKWWMSDPTIFWFSWGFVWVISSQVGDAGGGSSPYYLYLYTFAFGMVIASDWLESLVSSGRTWKTALGLGLCALILISSLARVDHYRELVFSGYDKLGPWIRERVMPGTRVLIVTVYYPSPALGTTEIKAVWPQDFTEEEVASFDPDVIVFDTRLIAGFRKKYREMHVAPLVDSFLSGRRGYSITARFPAKIFNRAYFAGVDPEHDVEIIVLERDG
jgi:hypothetical protein